LSDLQRFLDAQAATIDGYAAALAEIAAGRKRSHWIWYIFPQLSGLGRSAAAQTYAIAERGEAEAYLRHPLLRGRLLEITAAVAEKLRSGVSLPTLMGAEIDVLKLVSSVTLFREVANRVGDDAVAHAAESVLREADAQGYPPCEFTLNRLRGSR
jgi:uncharacterized protein (DUF1810 family)